MLQVVKFILARVLVGRVDEDRTAAWSRESWPGLPAVLQ